MTKCLSTPETAINEPVSPNSVNQWICWSYLHEYMQGTYDWITSREREEWGLWKEMNEGKKNKRRLNLLGYSSGCWYDENKDWLFLLFFSWLSFKYLENKETNKQSNTMFYFKLSSFLKVLHTYKIK